MKLVTGFAGKAHITSAQTGTFNAGVVGGGSYVMPTGEKLTATIITNNLIRVLDGDIVMNGRHITIPKGTYEEVEIANGLQGMKRNDLIVARYEKDANTGIETASLVVIQGTSTDETASDPQYNDNDIAEGTLISDMPLYRITLDGLAVGEPEPLFTVAKSMEELKNCISVLENTIDELNNKLTEMEVKIEITLSATDYITIPYPDGFNYDNCYIGGGLVGHTIVTMHKYPLSNTGVIADLTFHSTKGVMILGTEDSEGCACTIVLRKYPS